MINNEKFNAKLREIIGNDLTQYFDALQREPSRGFHINTVKCGTDAVDNLGFADVMSEGQNLRRVRQGAKPTAHPYYWAGLYYMQEPSAMLPVSSLGDLDNLKVLDMCASPGGKSSQLAIKMNGSGLLVSNEVDRQRAQVLRENIVRMGYSNTVVLSMNTKQLAEKFAGFFDVVVVDAPCSGEGMFRKEKQAMLDWSEANIEACAIRQKQIVDNADVCLKEGGLLLYSTCTFAKQEDEEVVRYILDKGYECVEVSNTVTERAIKCEYGYKYLPHIFDGEGQYFCLLQKQSQRKETVVFDKKYQSTKAVKKNIIALSEIVDIDALNICEKDGLLYVPALSYDIPCLVNGVLLAKIERDGRLTPAHQLFTALGNRCYNKVNLNSNRNEIKQYLEGLSINDNAKGWCCVTVDGYSLGGAKGSNGVVKNHYPKHLRVK